MAKKVSVIFGTRPEAIKLAPVVLALKRDPFFKCRVCVTAQHREMLDSVLDVFRIVPDADLNLMQHNQSLAGLTGRAIQALDEYLAKEDPDLVLVQGDTTTVFCATLAAFYRHIPVGHVEAGLRTGNLQSPWPEEANRVLASRLVDIHFAPTRQSRLNLVAEGIPSEKIRITGNTVIDALFDVLKRKDQAALEVKGLPACLQPAAGFREPRMVLITGHRRESFGQGFRNICYAIAELARRMPDVHFVYPVHLNPNVRRPVYKILGSGSSGQKAGSSRNIHLLEPLSYLPFVALMKRASLLLTDSGGVQEEAPSLHKPVLVMRNTTERPEGVKAGAVKLVGTDPRKIVAETCRLLTNSAAYKAMTQCRNPYGDGRASRRIVRLCKALFVRNH